MISPSPLGNITFYIENQQTQRPSTVNYDQNKFQSPYYPLQSGRQRRCTPIIRNRYIRQKFSLADNRIDNFYQIPINNNHNAEELKKSVDHILTERAATSQARRGIIQSCQLQKGYRYKQNIKSNFQSIPNTNIQINLIQTKLKQPLNLKLRTSSNNRKRSQKFIRQSILMQKKENLLQKKQGLMLDFRSQRKLSIPIPKKHTIELNNNINYLKNKQNQTPLSLVMLEKQQQKCQKVIKKYSARANAQKKQIQAFLKFYA